MLRERANSILSRWGSCSQGTQLLSQLSHLLIEVSRAQACCASVSPLVEGITLHPFFAKEQQENHPSSRYPQSQAAGPPHDWLRGHPKAHPASLNFFYFFLPVLPAMQPQAPQGRAGRYPRSQPNHISRNRCWYSRKKQPAIEPGAGSGHLASSRTQPLQLHHGAKPALHLPGETLE